MIILDEIYKKLISRKYFKYKMSIKKKIKLF